MSSMIGEATAGGVAGVFSLVSTYPLMVVKTRLQAQRKTQKIDGEVVQGKTLSDVEDERKPAQSALECLIDLIQHEGLRGAFSGIESSLPKAFVTNFIFYFAVTFLKPLFAKVKNKFSRELLLGIVAGTVVQLVMTPIDLVNTRVIADKSNKLGFFTTLKRVVEERGFLGLYRGIAPALVLTLNPGITNVVRTWLSPPEAVSTASRDFWTGAGSKACASIITYPYVVTKVQMMTSKLNKEKERPTGDETSLKVQATPHIHNDQSALSVIQRIISEEGAMGLYKGCELQVSTAVLKEALLNMARHPIKRFIMSFFVQQSAAPK